MTLDETGMIDALMADYYFMSTNTMTIDGELVNIDGNGNRVAALIYSPENVIILAGMNKVAKDKSAFSLIPHTVHHSLPYLS